MSKFHNIGDMRTKYLDGRNSFTEDQLVSKTDPYEQFTSWFQHIKSHPEIIEPNAMCLSTCSKDGQPSARFVLLKGYGKEIGGFTFFTHYTSRKGHELEENPKAALTFYWDKVNRQIRIEGAITKVPEEESESYFSRRPLASQIGAAASNQSQIIASRDVLVKAAEELAESCNGKVDKPKTWGGYLLTPYFIEFWQGQTDRLHDRICFRRDQPNEPWSLFRLAP